MAHSCSEKTPSPFSFHAKSMASQSPFARQLPPLTCFLITSKCCSRITPRFLKSESLPSSLNVSRGNDIPFRENAACASSVQCTYVCNVVYCCTVCCTSTAVRLYAPPPPPPQCSYCSRHRLSGRRSYLHPQFTAQLVSACSYWHLGTEHVFLWPCAYYYYFLRLKFLTTKFLTGDAVCTRRYFQHAINITTFIPIVSVGKRGAYYLVHGDLPSQRPFGANSSFTSSPVPADSRQ